jgi:hypothetical protein
VIEIVKSHHPHAHKALSAATREKIVDEIQNRYPAYDFPLFLKVDALWKRMGEHSDLF